MMLRTVMLDWMPGPHDALIVNFAAVVVLAPPLVLNGLLVTAIPGILMGRFVARRIEGSPVGPNVLFGTFLGIAIESIADVMHWWPYSEHGFPFLIPLVFRSLLPIWLIGISTSMMMPASNNQTFHD